jgi:hypothetical protein
MNKIGILGRLSGWENVLCQLGIPFKVLENQDDLRLHADIDALILSGGYCVTDLAGLQAILNENAIIIKTPAGNEVGQFETASRSIVWKDEEYRFEVGIEFEEKEQDSSGAVKYFPFNLDEITHNTVKRRQFYYERRELPSERVNVVNHYEIIRFVRNFLVDSFQEKGKELWGYASLPEGKPLFIFRIDTDFAEEKELLALTELCRKYGIAATWFVDVHSEKLLQYYEAMDDQEIGLHCDRHYVYKDRSANYENIKSGLDKLLNHQISPFGYAAPFGEWNAAMEDALSELDFSYSSEFAFAWDSLPVVRKQKGNMLLQIPIHPVSPGRLRRSHFSQKEMLDYYINRIEQNRSLDLPAIIYHHPAHGMLDLIEDIFKYIKENEFDNLTMHSYASWWLKRYESLSQTDTSELFQAIRLDPQYREFPEDYNRIYEKNWRWYLYEYEASKGKRYFKKHGYPAQIKSR